MRHIHDPLRAIEDAIGGANRLFLRALRRRAMEESPTVYLVGGPVRDVLLGFPVQDLDFVVEGDAPALARSLALELGGQVKVHPRFGTATVALGGSSIDLVTARRETYPRPGDLPQVTPGTIQEDLARRDFSINALAVALGEQRPGIIDPLGGLNDLAAGLVRILHGRSFIDDPTRILRAVRYEQRLGFALEKESRSRLHDALAGGYVAAVSGDRLRHELERILEERDPLPALLRAADLGVLGAIHPALGAGAGLARLAARPPATEEACRRAGPLVYLAALVYQLSPSEGESLTHRLSLPASLARVVRDTIELRQRESSLAGCALAASQIYYLVQGLADPAVAAVAAITPSEPVARRLAQYVNELARVRPLLRGDDLMAMGVPPGPPVGEVLGRLRQARLDREVFSEEDERRLVREILVGKRGA